MTLTLNLRSAFKFRNLLSGYLPNQKKCKHFHRTKELFNNEACVLKTYIELHSSGAEMYLVVNYLCLFICEMVDLIVASQKFYIAILYTTMKMLNFMSVIDVPVQESFLL